MNNKLLIGLIAIFILGVAIYLGSPKEQIQNITNNTSNFVPTKQPATEIKIFEVTGEPFSFNPAEIRVKKGDMVKIVFKNTEGFHDLVIDEYNQKTKQINAGDSSSIEFFADKKGEFPFYCSVGNHKEQGMEGKLIVE